MNKHTPASLEELKKFQKSIKNVNVEHKKRLSVLDRLAVWTTNRVGTMGFFFIIFFWTFVWLFWNIFAPYGLRFDPYPAFVFWLFISNMIQIFLMPLIMVGQNLQGRYAELRAEADFELNIKAEREIEAILQHLENQNELMLQIIRKLEEKRSIS